MTELPPQPPTSPTDAPAQPRFSRRPGRGHPAAPAEPSAVPSAQPGTPGDDVEPDWPSPVPAGGPGSSPRSRRGLIIAPLATVVAVAAVAAGVVALRHDNSDSGAKLRPLALVDALRQDEGAVAAPTAVGIAAGYRVEGTLPTGPARGQVRTFPTRPAPAADVAKLAGALGLTGQPVRSDSGWTVSSGGRALRVLDTPGWQWVFSSAADLPIDGGMACDVIVGGRRLCRPGRAGPGGGGKVLPIDPPAAGPRSGGSGGSAGTAGGSGDSPKSGTGSTVVDPAPSVGSGSGSGSTGSGGGPATGPGSSAGSAAGSAGSGGAALPPDAVPPVGVPPVGVPPVGVPPVGVPPVGATAVPMPVDPVPVGPRPDEAAVRKAAADVLAALGLNGADVQVASYPGFALVTAAPVVAGLPTSGYETRLQYDGSSTLTGGSGWLAPSAAGAEYPLISAQRAFDAMPKPEIARICPNTHPQNCAAPLTVITGARLGLALRHDQQFGPLLVPAWLYTLRGSALQPVAVAVDPAYLSPAPPAGYPMPAQTEPAPVRPPNPAPKPTR